MSGRAASRREHQRFCEIEGWSEVLNARGKPTQHHITYELALPDGRVLRTRISRPANTDTYGPGLWPHVLDDQLCVSEDDFWTCVDDAVVPDRGAVSTAPPENVLPASLAYQLVHTLGLKDAEVAAMTLDEAVQRMQEHWSRER